MMATLDLIFDGRRADFDRLFRSLDGAVAAGRLSEAGSVLEFIAELAKTSPCQVEGSAKPR